ncbi:MAG: hypothetical protein ACM3O3_00060 [Syntrophothermus sp.]
MFVLLALTDPISLLLNYIFRINSYYTFLIYSSIMLSLSFYYRKKISKFILLIVLLFTIVGIVLSTDYLKFFILGFNALVLINFVTIMLFNSFKEQKINYFYIVLVLYQLTVTLKFLIIILNVNTGPYFYFITTAFEILIGIYFIFFNNINSPSIRLVPVEN